MDVIQQIGVPVVGIIGAAAITFYAVSFMELREKSFRDLDEKEAAAENEGFNAARKYKERTARKKAKNNIK